MSQFRNATAPPPRKTVFLGETPLWQKIALAPGSSRSVTRSRREARTCRWVRGSDAAADLRQPSLRHGLEARALGPLSRNIRENLAAPLVRAEHPGRRRSPPSPGGEGGRVRPASRGPVPRRTVSPSFDTSLRLTPVRDSSHLRGSPSPTRTVYPASSHISELMLDPDGLARYMAMKAVSRPA